MQPYAQKDSKLISFLRKLKFVITFAKRKKFKNLKRSRISLSHCGENFTFITILIIYLCVVYHYTRILYGWDTHIINVKNKNGKNIHMIRYKRYRQTFSFILGFISIFQSAIQTRKIV